MKSADLRANKIYGLEALLDVVHGSSFFDSYRKYNEGCVAAVTVIMVIASLVAQFIAIYVLSYYNLCLFEAFEM